MTFHVDSEVGRLVQAIVHQPGAELSRLTPANADELLFGDVTWAGRAREEHDAFVARWEHAGVRVPSAGRVDGDHRCLTCPIEREPVDEHEEVS